MKKLMFLLAAASLSSVAFAQQKSNSQNVLVGESVDVMELSLIHISEPTRQAEISYAVFCLKKKKKKVKTVPSDI